MDSAIANMMTFIKSFRDFTQMEVIFSHLFHEIYMKFTWNLQAWNWFATKQAISIITTS